MRTILTALFITIVMNGFALAEESLTREMQVSIIADYMLVTGQGGLNLSATGHDDSESHPIKCGTPAILNFVTHRDRLDPELLKSLGVLEITRPTFLTDSVDSPRGLFRIHYTTSGIDALFGGAGTAVKIADIMDSVYAYIVVTLGYPPPPQDGYEPGGDEKYDIYMTYLGSLFYGQTWTDSLGYPTDQQATSYIEMNADPRRLAGYADRPLDAIRVTAAHEFFHAVQFGIDWGETEDLGSETIERRYWMEMSSTWMEEEIYDDINDYYSYLPFFFNDPKASLQQFSGGTDLHPYASVVHSIFLSEKFGRDIIREIWTLCGTMGFGPSFLRAADSAIMMVSNGAEDWSTTFAEFALWNYLTGERSGLSITDGFDNSPVLGYSEKAAYATIPFEKLHSYHAYPVLVRSNENLAESPDVNGSYYLTLNELSTATIVDDTITWACANSDREPAGEFVEGCATCCTDSVTVRDSLLWGPEFSYTTHIDTFFNIFLALSNTAQQPLPRGWGVSIIYQFVDAPDSLIVDRFFAPDHGGYKISLVDHRQYESLTFILTPATTNRAYYENSNTRTMWVGYSLDENSFIDTLINKPAAVLDPYPNPLIVADMDEPRMTFKLRVPTDSTSFPMYGEPFTDVDPSLQVDIYTVAGERIRTVNNITWREARFGEFFTEWDLKNESGQDIASGVYLIYARLFSKAKRGVLLAEDHSKVLVIR